MQSCPSQITRGEISNYRQRIEDFAKRFYHEGPGSVGDDLDKGKNIPFGLTRYLNMFCLRILWDDGMEQWFLTLPVHWAHLRIPKAHDAWLPDLNSLIPLFWRVVRKPRCLKLPWGFQCVAQAEPT